MSAPDTNPASDLPEQATALDLEMMRRALALADAAAAIGEVPVGAVVYRIENSAPVILGEGFNTRERDADPSAHAEFKAILAAARAIGDWRLEHCSLAVTLEPCPMCAGLIVNARVARVLYGAADPKAGAVRSLFSLLNDDRLNHRAAVIPGVLEQPATEKLRAFFRLLRARPAK